MNSQGWPPLGWTVLISLQSTGLSKVFSDTTVWKHQLFSAQPSLRSYSHIHRWLLEKPQLSLDRPLLGKRCFHFLIRYLGLSCIPLREQASFNFMAAVTIHSDFRTHENKIRHCFHFSPFCLPWNDGTWCHDLTECWVLSQLFHSFFTFIKGLFSSSSLSAIKVVSSAYLRLLIFLPAILIPACASSSPVFLMMYSV